MANRQEVRKMKLDFRKQFIEKHKDNPLRIQVLKLEETKRELSTANLEQAMEIRQLRKRVQ